MVWVKRAETDWTIKMGYPEPAITGHNLPAKAVPKSKIEFWVEIKNVAMPGWLGLVVSYDGTTIYRNYGYLGTDVSWRQPGMTFEMPEKDVQVAIEGYYWKYATEPEFPPPPRGLPASPFPTWVKAGESLVTVRLEGEEKPSWLPWWWWIAAIAGGVSLAVIAGAIYQEERTMMVMALAKR